MPMPTETSGGSWKVTRDMTDRKARENRLRQREQRSRRLLETTPNPVFLYTVDGELSYANKAAVEFLPFELDIDATLI